MKTIAIVLTGLLLASCSGHIVPPNMQFCKKCAETDDGQIVYSYVWMHKKGEQLKANKETCKLIKKQ